MTLDSLGKTMNSSLYLHLSISWVIVRKRHTSPDSYNIFSQAKVGLNNAYLRVLCKLSNQFSSSGVSGHFVKSYYSLLIWTQHVMKMQQLCSINEHTDC